MNNSWCHPASHDSNNCHCFVESKNGRCIRNCLEDILIEDGQGRVELDSDDGDEVPILQENDEVVVKDGEGFEVLRGTLKEN